MDLSGHRDIVGERSSPNAVHRGERPGGAERSIRCLAGGLSAASQGTPRVPRRLTAGRSKPGNLSPETIERAIDAAVRRNARTVILAALATASPKDLDFLHAMAEDDRPSVPGDIGLRIGAKTNLGANYRSRRKGQLRDPSTTPTPSAQN